MGIAGAGMGALALAARRRGVVVTGCDINLRDAQDAVAAGAEVARGHGASHVREARAVVYTSAVAPDHEELQEARRLGVPVMKRAEALGELVRGGTVVGVAGTHGKTTTTAMVTEALAAAGRRPTGIVGGRVAAWGGNARLDGDDLFVVEADEYDRSFLALHPTVAAVNNIEADHLECYGTIGALEDAFATFASRADRVLVGGDDAGARALAGRVSAPVWTVGFDDADVSVGEVRRRPEGTEARLRMPDGSTVTLRLRLPGVHNLRNAAMAMAVCAALEVDLDAAAGALREFRGVGRRFEVLGTVGGITVVDDYAHHPAEVAATLDAARQRFPGARLVVGFQPHLYSRTRDHGAAFGAALAKADVVLVTDIYPAREAPLEGVTAQLVVDGAAAHGADAAWVPSRDALAGRILELAVPGDVVLMLGAGDITEVSHALARSLAGAAA